MTIEKAIGYLIEMALRIFGLCIIIAESTVPLKNRNQRRYIKEQRDVMKYIQDDLNLYEMLCEEDEVIGE